MLGAGSASHFVNPSKAHNTSFCRKTRPRLRQHLMRSVLSALCLCFLVCPPAFADTKHATKTLYLTFDDGPSERYTPKILDELRAAHVHATFFVLGYRCDEFPQIVRRMHREGHELGNHGYLHEDVVSLSRSCLQRDVLRTDHSIYRASGVIPTFYRPPGGHIDNQERKLILQMGHPIRMWTVDSFDWKARSTQDIDQALADKIRPQAVILFHDGVSGSRYTAEILPKLLSRWKSAGYAFGTLK